MLPTAGNGIRDSKKDKEVMEIYGNDAVRDGIMEIIAKDPHVDLTRMRFHRIQKFPDRSFEVYTFKGISQAG